MSTLNRRNFLGRICGALALPILGSHFARGHSEEKPEKKSRFADKIKEVTRYTALSDYGDMRLEVELLALRKDQLEERPVKGSTYGEISFYYQGKELPCDIQPSRASVITKFDVFWGKDHIKIPKRFWEDLSSFDIQTVPIDSGELAPLERRELEEFEKSLRRPRVFMSAKDKTALIEWAKTDDYFGDSTMRWIVSRDGEVLRHRYQPPTHRC